MSRTMRLLAVLLMGTAAWLLAPGAAVADCGDGYGSQQNGGGVIVGGSHDCHGSDPGSYDPGNGPYIPSGPRPPAYEDYYTPACMINGPPGQGSSDAMCMGAATICQGRGEPGAIFMRHYHRLVGVPGANWELVGSECRGADDPVRQQPQVTQEMVLDAAYAAAPKPTAAVQPGNRSYVNLPNNYYADAQDQTVNVDVLGHPIAITFTVSDVTWDFGDGTSGSGEGVKDAAVGGAGAVEHAYTKQGSYTITATSTLGVQFTLPNGQAVDLPGAFQPTSAPVTLPIGEIQTRVDSTN